MYSKEEEEWFKKFQEGTFLVKGWKGRMKEILHPFTHPDKEILHQELEKLGEKIGREWSKENNVRRIDTPMLQKWGDELLAAKGAGTKALGNTINKLTVEIEDLLSNLGTL